MNTMLHYEVLRGQWLLAALGAGLVLILTAVATYLTIWRPRNNETPDSKKPAPADSAEERPGTVSFLNSLPPALFITFIGIALFMIVSFTDKIFSPPNW